MYNKYQEALDNVKRVYLESEHYDEQDIATLQELVDNKKAKLLNWEDIGYDNYHNANVYGCICPSCNLVLMEATDNEIEVKDPDSKGIRKAFLDVFSPDGNGQGLNMYCNRCGQKLDWSDEK